MKAFLDTGFLLTILTHRAGAEKAWLLIKDCDIPVEITSMQLFFVRHGLAKTLLGEETREIRDISVSALKLLNWLLQQDVIRRVEIEYEQVISVAEAWAAKASTPIPSLLLIWAACAAVSGAKVFLSFDPRLRVLATAAGLKVLPDKL